MCQKEIKTTNTILNHKFILPYRYKKQNFIPKAFCSLFFGKIPQDMNEACGSNRTGNMATSRDMPIFE